MNAPLLEVGVEFRNGCVSCVFFPACPQPRLQKLPTFTLHSKRWHRTPQQPPLSTPLLTSAALQPAAPHRLLVSVGWQLYHGGGVLCCLHQLDQDLQLPQQQNHSAHAPRVAGKLLAARPARPVAATRAVAIPSLPARPHQLGSSPLPWRQRRPLHPPQYYLPPLLPPSHPLGSSITCADPRRSCVVGQRVHPRVARRHVTVGWVEW